MRKKTYKWAERILWNQWVCPLSWLLCLHKYIPISKLRELYILNMCSLVYVNYTPITTFLNGILLRNKKNNLQKNMTWINLKNTLSKSNKTKSAYVQEYREKNKLSFSLHTQQSTQKTSVTQCAGGFPIHQKAFLQWHRLGVLYCN